LLAGIGLALSVGCSASITNEDTSGDAAGTFTRQGPNGLEQAVHVLRNVNALGAFGFELSSVVRNSGDRAVDIVVRTCRFSAADIEADPPILDGNNSFALGACPPGSERISLAPGDSVSLAWVYGVEAQGTYTLSVRHVLDPEFRTQAVLSIPAPADSIPTPRDSTPAPRDSTPAPRDSTGG